MNEEEFEDFKNYIKRYRSSTNDLVNKYITPYTLEAFKNNVLGKIDELQQRYKQSQNNWNELKKWLEEKIKDYRKREWFQAANDLKEILDKMQELEGNNDK